MSVCPRLHSLFRDFVIFVLFKIFRLLPLQNKVVATSFDGLKYADNPRFIVEVLHKKDPSIKTVWLRNRNVDFEVPSYVKKVVYSNYIRSIYEFATAKVWVSSHWLSINAQKRKGQFYIQTWHGGLGIKKIGLDVNYDKRKSKRAIVQTNKNANLFLSNSDFLTNVYRSAFGYQGPVWKCGYPKTDCLFEENDDLKKKIHELYSIPDDVKIMMFAPTFRKDYRILYKSIDKIPFELIKSSLEKKTGCKWVICFRWHPWTAQRFGNTALAGKGVVDVSDYPDIVDLVRVSSAFVTDYSSCIFDAAIREIPCFTYTEDYEGYKTERGVYFEMLDLPFPFAQTPVELVKNIREFDLVEYCKKWNAFKERVGLHETGHASEDVAELIRKLVHGDWSSLAKIMGG